VGRNQYPYINYIDVELGQEGYWYRTVGPCRPEVPAPGNPLDLAFCAVARHPESAQGPWRPPNTILKGRGYRRV
jgi:hypothetical protein